VQHAHTCGVLHRDLKPANILLDEWGEPHVTDFGLAKCLPESSDLTYPGGFVGTPSYTAPEQAAGRHDLIGRRTDIYSLGAILYTLLTGRPPFVGQSAADTLWKVRVEEPVRPRRLNPAVPRDLEAICLKCLEKDPQRRYATAADLSADLDRFLHDDPIEARRVSLLERVFRWARRYPVVSVLVVLLLLTGSALAVTVSIYGLTVQQQTEVLGRLDEAVAGEERTWADLNAVTDSLFQTVLREDRTLGPPERDLLIRLKSRYQEVADRQPDTPPGRARREEALRRVDLISKRLTASSLGQQVPDLRPEE
jgi:serine/threonine protein kinase